MQNKWPFIWIVENECSNVKHDLDQYFLIWDASLIRQKGRRRWRLTHSVSVPFVCVEIILGVSVKKGSIQSDPISLSPSNAGDSALCHVSQRIFIYLSTPLMLIMMPLVQVSKGAYFLSFCPHCIHTWVSATNNNNDNATAAAQIRSRFWYDLCIGKKGQDLRTAAN